MNIRKNIFVLGAGNNYYNNVLICFIVCRTLLASFFLLHLSLTRIHMLVYTCMCLSVQMYAGYVDDPRNTDNAWMETVVFNFHDDTG